MEHVPNYSPYCYTIYLCEFILKCSSQVAVPVLDRAPVVVVPTMYTPNCELPGAGRITLPGVAVAAQLWYKYVVVASSWLWYNGIPEKRDGRAGLQPPHLRCALSDPSMAPSGRNRTAAVAVAGHPIIERPSSPANQPRHLWPARWRQIRCPRRAPRRR
jgi:hypothetical protein